MKYLVKLCLLACLLLPSTAQPADQHIKTFWSCMQVVYVDDKPMVVLSEIQENHWKNYRHRENEFAKQVKKHFSNKLKGEYEPMCVDYSNINAANTAERILVKKTKKHGFELKRIKFVYRGD